MIKKKMLCLLQPFVCLFVCVSVYLFIYLFSCLFVCLLFCLYIYLFIYLCVYVFIYLFIYYESVYFRPPDLCCPLHDRTNAVPQIVTLRHVRCVYTRHIFAQDLNVQ
jgi:hypothetical protein